MRLLKSSLMVLLSLIAIETAAAPFSGIWLSCEQGSGDFRLLELEQNDEFVRGILEESRSGGVWSAELQGVVKEDALLLHGCILYRGEPLKGCDPSNAPVLARLPTRDDSSIFSLVESKDLQRDIDRCTAGKKVDSN